MSQENPQQPPTQEKSFALANLPLVTSMAEEYGYGNEMARFQETLIKTVFPSDKAVTNSQFLMFLQVCKKYSLDPLTKQIFAFPSKGGGIVPVVSIDGWIAIAQRQKQYAGHRFTYEWEDGKVGGKCLAATCIIFRKDLDNPIEHSEFMEEVARDTEPWKKWPRRMIGHRAFIQCARYAFGLSGLYDEDEAQRIMEAEVNITPSTVKEIKMPQRSQPVLTSGTITNVGQGVITIDSTTVPNNQPVVFLNRDMPGETVVVERRQVEPLIEAEMVTEEAQTEETGEGRTFFAGISDMAVAEETPAEQTPVTEPEPATKRKTIGAGHARRIHAIVNTKKTRTAADLEELKKTFKIDSLNDFPIDRYPELEKWAEGK